MHLSRIFLAATAASVAVAGAGTAAAKRGDKIEGSYICVFKAGCSGARQRPRRGEQGGQPRRRQHQARLRKQHPRLRYRTCPRAAAAQIAARNPNIAYCEQDQEVTADPGRNDLPRTGQADRRHADAAGAEDALGNYPCAAAARQRGYRARPGSSTRVSISIIPDLNVDQVRSRNFVTREESP